jgi:localization factor PodJL
MKLGVPWSVKGIKPEARETAREAARRSGLSLGEWLNTVIIHQAAQEGIEPDALEDDETPYGDDLRAVHERLDDITRRIDTAARSGPAAYAPKRATSPPIDRGRNEPDQLAALIERLDRRLDQFADMSRTKPLAPPLAPAAPVPPAIDRAVAEIFARQRTLNGEAALARPASAAPQAPPRAPLPAQDLSGLEQQLRSITTQIETLHKPGVEEAINALRDELGDIGRALTEAMPRRELDTIEKQIEGLTQRIAEGRQAGVDAGALGGIEQGLAEVRDALRALTPAENLIGFNEAVEGLAHKIDLIVAQRDPATMQQLETAITTLREMAAHVASDDTVSRLAGDVARLAEKIETIAHAGAGSDALNGLEHRISALSDALAERAQNGANVPPRLEALVESLSDKIEQIQHAGSDSMAMGHLEDRIVSLVEKLDASDSRLGHLESIERGLADLLVHIEDMRANKDAGALRAEASPAVDTLKHDIARTQDALDAVHGTLGHVVDRLAMIEQGIRGEPRRPAAPDEAEPLELTQPVGRLAVRVVEDVKPAPAAAAPALAAAPAPAPVAAPAPTPPPAAPQAAAPKRLPPAPRLPIEPDLPPDQPLEPGSGRPHMRANPGARIAASEAALGGAGAAAAPTGGKSSFIAAARRAAQAAGREPPPRAPIVAIDASEDADTPNPLRARLMKRMKSLFVAASIIAVVIGSVQIAANFVDFGGTPQRTAQSGAGNTAAGENPTGKIDRTADAGAPQTVASSPPPVVPNLTPPASVLATEGLGMTTPLNPMPPQSGEGSPSILSAPGANLPGGITGSITRPAGRPPAAARAPFALPNGSGSADRLPEEIGSVRLRSAATAGDAAAAYEVGVRFAEGRGVPADMAEAAHWFERAAVKGLAPAQFRYGSLLEKGQGVKKDLAQARRLYLAAAAKGNAKAMHNLAVLYAEGIDGKPEYAVAAQWFRKAADRGVADSQFNLGVLYARGLGVEMSLADSYKWFALAAAKGDKDAAKKRDDIAARLDAKALAAAEHAVKAFVAEPQPEEAVNVPQPAGGWDNAGATPPAAKARPKISTPMVIGKR